MGALLVAAVVWTPIAQTVFMFWALRKRGLLGLALAFGANVAVLIAVFVGLLVLFQQAASDPGDDRAAVFFIFFVGGYISYGFGIGCIVVLTWLLVGWLTRKLRPSNNVAVNEAS
jgi:hypothetical protein